MDSIFERWMESSLVWLHERGVGYLTVKDRPYDAAYWQKYIDYAETPLGRHLNTIRNEVTDRWVGQDELLVDVGIGCGQFVESRPRAFGFDINPVAVRWLKAKDRWLDPYKREVDAATFWDVIEHIDDPEPLLANVRRTVLISLPIFVDARHVLSSKHFRRDEHCWYFTRDGLIDWMHEYGFEIVEHGTPESIAGREDIHTFVFRRPE